MADMVILTEEFFIGRGGHQATYVHPEDPTRCIKIPHEADDGDVKKELKYRRVCAKKFRESILVMKYYGEIETSLGKGYVFERALDYDGKTSQDLSVFLPKDAPEPEGLRFLQSLLLDLKENYLREKIAIADEDITNFMVQRLSPTEARIRIVDNIGTPAWIPLVYYFDFCAAYRARRYWEGFSQWLHRHYPYIVTEEFLSRLKK